MKKRIMAFAIITGLIFTVVTSFGASKEDKESIIKKGEEAFHMNGCSGCHKIGKDWNGPDLTYVTTYRSKEWIIEFILNPEKYYEDPTVKTMIRKFNLYMPNQGVSREDAELIYEYLKSLPEKVEKEKKVEKKSPKGR